MVRKNGVATRGGELLVEIVLKAEVAKYLLLVWV